jgi:hypothetical protein
LIILGGIWQGGCTTIDPAASGRRLAAEATQTALLSANVGVTSVLVLTTRTIRGTVDGPGDILEALVAGAVGGSGFHFAKQWAGSGGGIRAIALAYAATSIMENSGEGEHPFGRLRYGFGPADLLVRTPLSRGEGPRLTVDLDALSLVGSGVALLSGADPHIQEGVLYFRAGERASSSAGASSRSGIAIGRLIVLESGASVITLRHETVHRLQSAQLDAFAPSIPIGSSVGLKSPVISVETGAFTIGAGLLSLLRPYSERWTEIEAYNQSRERAQPTSES